MKTELVIKLVGFMAGMRAPPDDGVAGVVSPYIHWSATTVWTNGDLISARTVSSFLERAVAGCSWRSYFEHMLAVEAHNNMEVSSPFVHGLAHFILVHL